MRRFLIPCSLLLALVLTANAQEKSVKPGINAPFKNPDVAAFQKIFVGESREVFVQREKIVAACGVNFLQLLDYTSVGLAAVSGLMIASVFPIRRRRDLARPYRLRLFPIPPFLYLGLVGWTIAQQLAQLDRFLAALFSLGTLLAGVPLAWFFLPRPVK